MNTTAQALAYLELGWMPIPIPLCEKRPVLDGWPKLRVAREDVPRYFPAESNIGVILGDASGGLVDIDLDMFEAVQAAALILPPTMVFGRKSNLRSHHLFIARYARTEKFTDLNGKMIVELRANQTNGEEGLQTVFPESIHPSGETVEWDHENDHERPLEMPADALRNLVAQVAGAVLLSQAGWSIDDGVAAVKDPGRHIAQFKQLPDRVYDKLSRWLGLTPRKKQEPQQTPRSSDREFILRRAKLYLEKVPGAVSGAGGHQQTWSVALNIVAGFDLSESEAYELLSSEYNHRCDPPWSERELRHKISGASKAHSVPRGYLLNQERPGTPSSASKAAARPQEEPESVAEDADSGFPTTRISDVQDDGPVKWLVQDLWLDQAVGIIGGEPKSYKSFVSAQIATCVAAGKPIFGKYAVTQGRVLMFNAEDRPQMTRSRIAQMCRALDVDLATLDVHLISIPVFRLDDDEQVASLRRTVAKLKPTLLILDPLRDLHGKDENDAQVVAALLGHLRVIQREYGCAVLLVHHMAKQSEIKRRAGQRLRGSSALHGWVDSALYLQHKDGAIEVQPEHRAAPSPNPFRFTLESIETDSGAALWLGLQRKENDEEETAKNEAAENKVIQALAAASEPLTGRDIRKACKQRAEATVEAIKRLVSSGVLAEEAVTRGHQVVPAYCIRTSKKGGEGGSRNQ